MVLASTDLYASQRFQLEIAGIRIAAFSEASMLGGNIEALAYREGTDPSYQRSSSDISNGGKLVLKKGLTDSTDLHDWYQLAVLRGASARGVQKNVSLYLTDTEGNTKARWNMINAWPSKYESSGVDAASNKVLLETLELTMDYMTRIG